MTGIIDPALFGMPNATNTGVPAGTTLTAYTGPMTITTPGTVIDGKIINGTLTVLAANVTIKNCVVQNYGFWGIDASAAAAIGNVTVQNCTLTASSSMDTDSAIVGSGTFIGNNISNSENGIRLQDGASVVRDNYIHDLNDNFGDPHLDGIALQGGQNHVLIEHNTVSGWDTSDIFIKNDFGPINDITVKNNLLIGDPKHGDVASAVYVYGPNTTNVTVTNNYMEKPLWEYVAVSNANPTISGNIQWDNKTAPTPYPSSLPSSPSTPSSPTPPSAPTIASFSNDTGTSGDHITSDNTIELKGTAVASSTVTLYDNGKQIGTTQANASGSWDYITGVLTDATHALTAKVTSGGQISAASAAMNVTVDTAAPNAPVVASDAIVNTSQVKASGTAAANSAITVYDGNTVVGTGAADASGNWTITTSALSNGTHNLLAKATDAAGNVSAASQTFDAVIGGSTTPTPATPKIVSFSNDSGKDGSDHITNDNTLTLSGTAAANSTVKVFDGSSTTPIGTATADASGHWSLNTPTLTDGVHNFTVTGADSTASLASTSLASAPASGAFSITIDTHAPNAPSLQIFSQDGKTAVGATTTLDDLLLKGAAEANSSIKVFDGGQQIGTATTDGSGAWSYDTGHLTTGSHSFTATAADVAGNTSSASAAKTEMVTAPSSPSTPSSPTPLSASMNAFGTIVHTVDGSEGQVYALYDGLLGRNPDLLGYESWLSASAHGASPRDIAAALLASPEGVAKFGSLDNAAFVEQLYETALHRPADSSGLQGWLSHLNNGASRADVALGIALSSENVADMQHSLAAGVFAPDPDASNVARLYYGLLGRAPDANGLNEWTHDLKQGASLDSVVQQFMNSAEYQKSHAGMTDAQLIDSLYVNALGRHAEPSALQAWVNELHNGTSQTTVAAAIVESPEAQQHHLSHIEKGWLHT